VAQSIRGSPGVDSHIQKGLGLKKAVLVPPRVLSLKRSMAGAFAVLIRVLSQKYMTGK